MDKGEISVDAAYQISRLQRLSRRPLRLRQQERRWRGETVSAGRVGPRGWKGGCTAAAGVFRADDQFRASTGLGTTKSRALGGDGSGFLAFGNFRPIVRKLLGA